MSFGAEIRGFVNGFQAGYKMVKSPQELEDERIAREYNQKRLGAFDREQEREDERLRLYEENINKPSAAEQQRIDDEAGILGSVGTGPVKRSAPSPDIPPVETTPGESGALDTGVPGPVATAAVSDIAGIGDIPQQYQQAFSDTADAYGLNPLWHAKLIRKESRFNPDAISPKGAIGLAQMMPDTAKRIGVDPNDPFQSITGSGRYLRQLIDHYGNETDALVAYHNGEKGANDWIAGGRNFNDLGPEAQDYLTVLDTGDGLSGDPTADVADKSYAVQLASQYAEASGLPEEALAADGQQPTTAAEAAAGMAAGALSDDPSIAGATVPDSINTTMGLSYEGGLGPYNSNIPLDQQYAAEDVSQEAFTRADAAQQGNILAEAPVDIRPQAARGAVEDPTVEPPAEPAYDGRIPVTAEDVVTSGKKIAQQAAEDNYAYFNRDDYEAALTTPDMEKAAERWVTGYLAPPKHLIDELERRIDPDGTMDPQIRTMLAFKAPYDYFMNNNEPEKAAKAAVTMLNYYKRQHFMYDSLAKAAGYEGAETDAIQARVAAFAHIPDGRDIDLSKDQNGQVTMTIKDLATGKITNQQLLSPDDVGAIIFGGEPADFEKMIYDQTDGVQGIGKPPSAGKAYETGLAALRLADQQQELLPNTSGPPSDFGRGEGAIDDRTGEPQKYRTVEGGPMPSITDIPLEKMAPDERANITAMYSAIAEGKQGRIKTAADAKKAGIEAGQQAAYDEGIARSRTDESSYTEVPSAGYPHPRSSLHNFILHKGTGELPPPDNDLMRRMGPLAKDYMDRRKQIIDEHNQAHPKPPAPMSASERVSTRSAIDAYWDDTEGSIPTNILPVVQTYEAAIKNAAFDIADVNRIPGEDGVGAARSIAIYNPPEGSNSRGWVATPNDEDPDGGMIVQFGDGSSYSVPRETFYMLKGIQDQQINAQQKATRPDIAKQRADRQTAAREAIASRKRESDARDKLAVDEYNFKRQGEYKRTPEESYQEPFQQPALPPMWTPEWERQ